MESRSWLASLALLAGVSLMGCGKVTAPEFSPLGEYLLVSVNDASLPVLISQGPSGRSELVAASIELMVDDVCWATQTLRHTFQDQVTTNQTSEGCVYEVSDSQIRIEWDEGGADTGTLQGNRLTLSTLGVAMVFER
jgi:hypothetical protein